MLFALAFDKIVWNSTPSGLSIVGSGLILGSTIYVAILNERRSRTKTPEERVDEESSLVVSEEDEGYEESPQRETGTYIGSQ